MQGSKDLPNGTVSVKVEPGTSTQRLPSLKPPRDLSLSAFSSKLVPNLNQSNKKRVYTPNLNVQRNKSSVVTIKQEPKENKPKVNSSERGREERGRGRGKKRELVQLNSGLFSESFGPSLKANRYGRSGGGGDASSSKSVLQKPKLNKDDNIKIDKEEEDMMLKELLRDDFIDDPNLEPDYENSPIKLPLYESNIFSKNNIKKIKTEPGTSGGGDHNSIGEQLTKIKIEPGLEENEEALEVDIRKIKIEPGLEDQQVKPEGKLTEINLTADKKSSLDSKKPKTPTVKEIMNSREPQFVMLQLPSCMPGLKPEVDTRQTQPSSSSSTSSSSQSNAGTSKNSNSNNNNSTTEQPSNKVEPDLRCTLQTLKPGKIGKMQILKSGRIRLVLGDAKLWLEMGTQVAFEQDLISVDLDRNSKTGYTICMGSVPVRMSVTPDWEQMILST